tara:strand:+ start:491 stop:826 length:336 start_codon:yes stop_codon:yes gene_type:complete
MKNTKPKWSKTELKIYILLLCANADTIETEEELNLIRSKIDQDSYERMYSEFSNDNEDLSFEKIKSSVAKHEYSNRELSHLKSEIQQIFLSDKRLGRREQYLERILNNILY